jgi:hypothetical protein
MFTKNAILFSVVFALSGFAGLFLSAPNPPSAITSPAPITPANFALIPPGTIGATLNAAIAAAPTSIEIVVPPGVWNVEQTILVPNSKAVVIRGEVGAQLTFTSATAGDKLIKVQNDNDSWEGSLEVRDLKLRARSAANQSCFGTDSADKVNYNKLHLENLWMSSSGYDVRFDNQEYTITPIFRGLRGGNGIYWSGAAHAASNLIIENCRFQNGRRGPQIYVYGARNWTIRNNICEGSVALDGDVDPDAIDVRRTKGILLINPGPANGTIDSQWLEYWATEPTDYLMTFVYTLNNGGSNKCGTYTIKNTDIRRLQVLNTSTTDEMTLAVIAGGWELPNFSDVTKFKADGKVSVIVSGGGQLDNKYRFDNPKVKIESAVSIMSGFDPIPYRDSAAILYAYKGGTGIYHREAAAGDWAQCRPYVQHHPKHGHSIVMKATTRLNGSAFTAPMKTLGNGRQVQEMWANCPHLELTGTAPTNGNSYGAGMMATIGNRFMYEAGHSPKRYIGSAEVGGAMPFVRCVSNGTTVTSGKWLQLFSSTAWKGGFGEPQPIPVNYDCYEWPNEPGPVLGTSIIGDICRPVDIASPVNYWLCTEAGTSRPIAVTCNAAKNVASITAVSDVTEILVGDYIDVAGATGTYRVIDIAAGVATLDKKIFAAVNLTGAVVTNHGPVWVAK